MPTRTPPAARSASKLAVYHVPSVERAIAILEHIAGNPGSGLSEIATALGVPVNAVFRICQTLASLGYLDRDDDDKRFRLSPRLYILGQSAVSSASLVSVCSDAMRQLRDATRETAAIGVRSELHGVVLEQYPSPQPFRFVIDPGNRFMLHTSAPGKAMLAFLPDNERDRVVSRLDLIRYTARTLATVSALTNELKEIRRDGWSADRGEENDGCHCVGAPILDHQGLPIAAIWVTGPSNRLPLDMMASVAEQVKECAAGITHRLGGNQRGHR